MLVVPSPVKDEEGLCCPEEIPGCQQADVGLSGAGAGEDGHVPWQIVLTQPEGTDGLTGVRHRAQAILPVGGFAAGRLQAS